MSTSKNVRKCNIQDSNRLSEIVVLFASTPLPMAQSIHCMQGGLGLTSQQVWAITQTLEDFRISSTHDSFSQVRKDVVGIENFIFRRIAPFALKNVFLHE